MTIFLPNINAKSQKEITKAEIKDLLDRQISTETDLVTSLEKIRVYMVEAGLNGKVKLFLLSEIIVNNFKDQLEALRWSISNYKDALSVYDNRGFEIIPWIIGKANKKLRIVVSLRDLLKKETFPAFKKELKKTMGKGK